MKKDWILEKVIEAGYKVTEPRKQIFALLSKKTKLFCVADIIKALPKLDKVSVYRTIELLEELDIIHKVAQFDGQQYYERHSEIHHHHIVCTDCRETACVSCKMPEIKVSGFFDVHHTVNLTGKCKSCLKKYA